MKRVAVATVVAVALAAGPASPVASAKSCERGQKSYYKKGSSKHATKWFQCFEGNSPKSSSKKKRR